LQESVTVPVGTITPTTSATVTVTFTLAPSLTGDGVTVTVVAVGTAPATAEDGKASTAAANMDAKRRKLRRRVGKIIPRKTENKQIQFQGTAHILRMFRAELRLFFRHERFCFEAYRTMGRRQ
jgi:hypothetical protein